MILSYLIIEQLEEDMYDKIKNMTKSKTKKYDKINLDSIEQGEERIGRN